MEPSGHFLSQTLDPTSEVFDPAPYIAAPERSAICKVEAVREVDWKLPKLEMPAIAYVAFVSTIAAVSLVGISFTARHLFTPSGRRSFLISAGVATFISLVSVLLTIRELRQNPPVIPVVENPVQVLADVKILALGKESELLGNEKVSVDVTPRSGRFTGELKPGSTIRLWVYHSMTQKGIFLINHAVEIPEAEVDAQVQAMTKEFWTPPASLSTSTNAPAQLPASPATNSGTMTFAPAPATNSP